jgi:hypothetical protein
MVSGGDNGAGRGYGGTERTGKTHDRNRFRVIRGKKGRNEIWVPVERAKKGAGRVGVGLAKWSDPVTEYYSVPMVLYNILLYIYSPCITSSRR